MQNGIIDLISITEFAAISTYKAIGQGNKLLADGQAVNAMEEMINKLDVSATIVIGEGEIDQAPQLYLGQKLGKGGAVLDIAVDPIEGTKMVAYNQANAIAVMALTTKGGFLSAPDMYMEKLVCGKQLAGKIDLSLGLENNIRIAAEVLEKPVSEITIAVLDKPRHKKVIKQIIDLGAKVSLIPDGDVLVTLELCLSNKYDLMYLVGGSPEGVLNAVVAKIFEGDMQARLVDRVMAKGETEENKVHRAREQELCIKLGIEIGSILTINDLVASEDLIFLATGITDSQLLGGVRHLRQDEYEVNSLFLRSSTGTKMKINSVHDMSKKEVDFKL